MLKFVDLECFLIIIILFQWTYIYNLPSAKTFALKDYSSEVEQTEHFNIMHFYNSTSIFPSFFVLFPDLI
jgi:hypothetical protein